MGSARMTEAEAIKLVRSWSPHSLAFFYEWMQQAEGFKLPAHLLPVVYALTDSRIDNLMLQVGPGAGKALHPDTPVLTDTGWRPIGALAAGDRVMRPDGLSTVAVLGIRRQPQDKLYRLTFADGREVVAHGNHQWLVHNKKMAAGVPWRIRTTREILSYARGSAAALRWYVPLCAPIEFPSQSLPIAPYALGLLLRDGSWDKFVPERYKTGSVKDRYAVLQGLLDADGTVSKEGSVSYCTTSQRLANDVASMIRSLGGIAYIGEKTPKCRGKECRTAYNVSIRHPEPASLFSLPRKVERARDTQYTASLKLEIVSIEPVEAAESVCIQVDHPDGLFLCGDYVVTHNSQLLSVVYPAWLVAHDPSMTNLIISGAEELAAGFMTAAGGILENNANFRLAFPEVQPDKGLGWSNERGLYVTGRPASIPDASILALGLNSKRLTGKHGRQLILDDLHDKDNSATELQCANVRRTYTSQVAGRADVQGARVVLAGRRWHEADLYGALQNDGTFICMTLPAERPGSDRLWFDVTVPEGIECVFTDGMVETFDGDLVPISDHPPPIDRVETHGEGDDVVRIRHLRWFYGSDYMRQGFFWPNPDHPRCKRRGPGHEPKRTEYFTNKRREPAQTEATYQCNPGARQGSVFLDGDFARRFAAPADLALGCYSPEVKSLLKTGALVIQAWDTAFSASARSDFSVCVTSLLVPCDQYHHNEDPTIFGPCEAHYDVLVLDVYRERLDYADISAKFKEMFQRWQPSAVVVEKKAYGVAIVETMMSAGLPIEAVMPGQLESKRARAVEGVGAGSVQGWCRQGRVALPRFQTGEAPEWVEGFIREAKDFTGEPGNRDDQVDAFVYGVQWAIRNGGGFAHIGETGPAHTSTQPATGPLSDNDPRQGPRCSRCRHLAGVAVKEQLDSNRNPASLPPNFCMWHNLLVQEISQCPEFSSPGDDADDFAAKMYSF